MLRKWWRPVREVIVEILVPVPKGFETPLDGKPGEDPRFLREMADSMRACPVVYENMNSLLKKRMEQLRQPPPATTQAERDTFTWRAEQAAIEANLLRSLLLGPASCAQALNDLKKHREAVQSEDNTNWATEERTS